VPTSPASDSLVNLGWDDRVAALWASVAADGLEPARVGRVDRDRCLLFTAGGTLRARAETLPATGDWVALRRRPAPAVAAVVPRWSTLARDGQVLAANVDVVLVVAALDRPLNVNRIERELVLAWDSGAQPVVVLTKADRADDADGAVETVTARAVGVAVVLTSATEGAGVDGVARRLRPHRTAVLLGPSGAGKSTLANRLLGADVLATRDVRAGDGKGRHTTTSRHLLVVPSGGVLIDTPGLRSLGLSGTEAEGVAMTFPDIEEASRACRFRDCRHEGEPGCAVAADVAEGRLDADRVASYRKLDDEAAGRSLSPRERAEANRKERVVHRAQNALYKARKR
jgi:ribosome biogenesis GTPase